MQVDHCVCKDYLSSSLTLEFKEVQNWPETFCQVSHGDSSPCGLPGFSVSTSDFKGDALVYEQTMSVKLDVTPVRLSWLKFRTPFAGEWKRRGHSQSTRM